MLVWRLAWLCLVVVSLAPPAPVTIGSWSRSCVGSLFIVPGRSPAGQGSNSVWIPTLSRWAILLCTQQVRLRFLGRRRSCTSRWLATSIAARRTLLRLLRAIFYLLMVQHLFSRSAAEML